MKKKNEVRSRKVKREKNQNKKKQQKSIAERKE